MPKSQRLQVTFLPVSKLNDLWQYLSLPIIEQDQCKWDSNAKIFIPFMVNFLLCSTLGHHLAKTSCDVLLLLLPACFQE